MIPIKNLFETHISVCDLDRSVAFYRDVLGLELAATVADRKVAFFWIGGRGKSMLGVWETGSAPLRMSLHLAFEVGLPDLLEAPRRLCETNVIPRDFFGAPADEPSVLGWMPAAALYFYDPDGHQLEFLSMLAEPPRPEAGIIKWSDWQQR